MSCLVFASSANTRHGSHRAPCSERGNYWSLRNVATLLVDSNIWFVVLWSLAISGATIVYDLSAGVNARHNRAVALKMLGMPKCSEKVYCK